MNVEWTARPCGDATLVELALTSERPRRVRVESTGDGPIRPPRTGGVPDAGWDERGYTGVVDGHLGVGYATTEPPADPPVDVEWRGPPDDDATFDAQPDVPSVEATPDGVVRTLSDPRPPREAAAPERASSGASPAGGDGEGEAEHEEETRSPERLDRSEAESDDRTAGDEDERGATHRPSEAARTSASPTGLAVFERRVALAERLADAGTLAEASAAVAAAGGLDGVRALDRAISQDRADLGALVERVETLRERAEAVDVPTETLARIGGEEA